MRLTSNAVRTDGSPSNLRTGPKLRLGAAAEIDDLGKLTLDRHEVIVTQEDRGERLAALFIRVLFGEADLVDRHRERLETGHPSTRAGRHLGAWVPRGDERHHFLGEGFGGRLLARVDVAHAREHDGAFRLRRGRLTGPADEQQDDDTGDVR